MKMMASELKKISIYSAPALGLALIAQLACALVINIAPHSRLWMKQQALPHRRPCESQRDAANQTPLTKNAFSLKPLGCRVTFAMTTPLGHRWLIKKTNS
jgi:hypothetical protein